MHPTNGPKPPTPTAMKFVRYVKGYGVGVGLGLPPFLGEVSVPGFRALVMVLPTSMRGTLIALVAFLMGFIAVVVQLLAADRTTRTFRRRLAAIAIAFALLGFGGLFIARYTLVLDVTVGGKEGGSVAFWPGRLPNCGCPPTVSDEACIEGLSTDRAAMAQCFRLRPAEAAIAAAYIVAMGALATLVAVAMLGKPREGS